MANNNQITDDDEREAREWADTVLHNSEVYNVDDAVAARTILALLDRPTLPRPEDVPDDVWQAVNAEFHRYAYTVPGIQAAYRALYDHYAQPPAPKPVEAWAAINSAGDILAFADGPDAQNLICDGCRIVKLVEDRDDR